MTKNDLRLMKTDIDFSTENVEKRRPFTAYLQNGFEKKRSDSGRSKKYNRGAYSPFFREMRFSTFQMAKKLKMLEFALKVLKLPEGAL